jgi:HEAT repeat protein
VPNDLLSYSEVEVKRTVDLIGKLGDERFVDGVSYTDSSGVVRRVSLGDMLFDKNLPSLVKSNIAEALGRISGDRAADLLVEAVRRHDDKHARFWSACALAESGRRSDVSKPFLKRKMLHSWNVIDREYATDWLKYVATEDDIPALGKALRDSDKYVQMSAAEILEKIGSPKAEKYLLRAYSRRNNYRVRSDMLSALGKVGGEKARRKVIKVLETDPNITVRLCASDALKKIEKRMG